MTTDPITGYAPVNGLDMYYEVHGKDSGEGEFPLLVLHGGGLTIDLCFGPLLPGLTTNRRVIAAELQGHGHTASPDRELTFELLAADVVGLLDHLGIERADVFGFSLGGLVSLETAVRHPGRVNRVVLASTHSRTDGYHPEIFDPEQFGTSKLLPTEADFKEMYDAYVRVAPDPGRFEAALAKTSALVTALPGWTDDELRSITAPTLLLLGDTDFVRIEHAVAMRDLIPNAQLALLPGTTHMDVMRRVDVVLPIVEGFLTQAS
ncbi:alpha/beta hydrolase [Streptomyces sp. SID3343]|uniref:alpha/beta fold hydrolase n=1 Tax=Streptomyces sp. SID3343 TaxID=2690260 RepID=UPI00136ECEA9|nr:alpha/beta hydrolase [Streptomyces sp. SID3343]MYV99735.1 alpha/beta fold hydrolase [Streptomyces sp. SID3343]